MVDEQLLAGHLRMLADELVQQILEGDQQPRRAALHVD
jgi:hypothetical protein